MISRAIESSLVYFAVIYGSGGEKKWMFAFRNKVNAKVKAKVKAKPEAET